MLRGRLGDVVDVVVAVRVGQLLWGVMVDLGEDERREGRGLRGGRGRAFREDGGVVGDARAVIGGLVSLAWTEAITKPREGRGGFLLEEWRLRS